MKRHHWGKSEEVCGDQILRERVATGRRLVEAILTALPVMQQPVEAPAGHRARRARSEYGAHRHAGTPEKTTGKTDELCCAHAMRAKVLKPHKGGLTQSHSCPCQPSWNSYSWALFVRHERNPHSVLPWVVFCGAASERCGIILPVSLV